MEIKFTSKEKNEVTFDITFDAEEFENAQIEAYKKTKDRYQVDGFRKGKTPRKIIEQHYGEGVFMQDAMDELLNQSYPKAIDELELEPIDRPRIDFSQIKKGEGFTANFVVDVEPEIEVKDYTGVKIKQAVHTVSDEDVQKELEMAQLRAVRTVEVDREAANDDNVNIDFEGSLDGELFEGGSAKSHDLKLGSGSFIPGFEEQLIGTKKGDEVDVNVKFPEEYQSEELAGKDAVFKVKINSVIESQKPELDDSFAQDTSEFESLDELRESIRKGLEKAAETSSENEMKNSVLEGVFEENKIDLPDSMIEATMDDMVEEFASNMKQQGMDFAQFLQYSGKTQAEFRDSIKDDAIKRTMMRLIIKAVVKAENFEVTQEELDIEINAMAAQYGLEVDKLREMLGEQQLELVKNDIKNRKAVDYMYEMAIIEPADESEKEK